MLDLDLPELKELYIYINESFNFKNLDFKELKRLAIMNLDHYRKETLIDLKSLNLPKLSFLNIYNLQINGLNFYPSIENMVLRNCITTDFLHLEYLPLTILKMNGNNIDKLKINVMPVLEEIDLNNNNIKDLDIDLNELKELSCRSSQIEKIKLIAPKLTSLSIDNNKLNSFLSFKRNDFPSLIKLHCFTNTTNIYPSWFKTLKKFEGDFDAKYVDLKEKCDTFIIQKLIDIGINTINEIDIKSIPVDELCKLLFNDNEIFILKTKDYDKEYNNNECYIENNDSVSAIEHVSMKYFPKGKYIYYNKQCYTIGDILSYFDNFEDDTLYNNPKKIGSIKDFLTNTPFIDLDPSNYDKFYNELVKMNNYRKLLNNTEF